jgi:hypothetical protein
VKETIMATAEMTLSTGPALAKQEQGVHIIFVPPEVQPDPGPDVYPSQEELDAVSSAIGDVAVTDVIVFAGKPWHKVQGRLRKHPDVHTEFQQTVLKLLIERGETAVWWSEHDFTITEIKAHDHAVGGSAPPFPVPATADDYDASGMRIRVAKSSVPPEAARNHEYKVTFTRSQQTIDPNMKCI